MTPIRWAILGTANIAAKAFLPALRAVGGEAVIVGSRDPEHARAWAEQHGVTRTADYAGALHDAEVDAVYVALPNREHTQWTAAALATGRAVLCEKPLGLDATDVANLLETVDERTLLWESFVFPFHPQSRLIRDQVLEIGVVHEITSEFHFTAADPDNIRWQQSLGGGALMDVGCYPIRLARLIYGTEALSAVATASMALGVDADVAAVLNFPGDQRLALSAGMRNAQSTFTRIRGEEGELRIENPFHPRLGDTVQRWAGRRLQQEWTTEGGTAFEYLIEHVHAVVRGQQPPRHLARTDSLGNAVALDLVRGALGKVPLERS